MAMAYFDCFSGISGDMTLGALVDLGLPVQWLKTQLTQLPLNGFDIHSHMVQRNGIQAVKVDVISSESHHHRDYGHICALIDKAPYSQTVKANSLAIFERIARAEAKIHGCDMDTVHFHEVGGLDAIVDIVGTCLGLEYLGVDTLMASPLPLGRGFVDCAHGTLPVPAPAVLEILKQVPVYGGRQAKELVTPTGAGIVAAMAAGYEPLPAMRIERIGYGAGSHELNNQPNVLRVILGRSSDQPHLDTTEKLLLVETCIDDMNPELFGHLMETLFVDGALDVYWVPVQMKKNRPGTLVQVLCAPDRRIAVVHRILAETTSLGVRYHEVYRTALKRESIQVQTAFGSVLAKKVTGVDGADRIVPEFDSCRKIALDQGVPIRLVYESVTQTTAA